MFPIKRLYLYIYQSFLPFLGMTTSVVLFIFVIQQIWQNIEKLVGKGLDSAVILEFLLYAILTLLPQVIPLAILLASLMVFGSLGEKLELLSIKASGVSLLRIFNPMIILVVIISIGSFYYQDKFVPVFNVKLQSLFRSIEQKNPDVAIPEGSFYNEVPGYSIYVKYKDKNTKTLHDVMIYDLSGGFKNISVDYCDSAQITTAPSKDYQILTLYSGERFSNIKADQQRKNASRQLSSLREKYQKKVINIPFSSQLERVDEARYGETYIAKTLSQLKRSSDSMKVRLDSINQQDRITVLSLPLFQNKNAKDNNLNKNTKNEQQELSQSKNLGNPAPGQHTTRSSAEAAKKEYEVLNPDSVFNSYSTAEKSNIIASALADARGSKLNNMMFSHMDSPKHFLQRNIRMHEIKWYETFKYSISCIIFFFIGASLGAIIGKGGLGIPVILSVFLYIFYHIINNVGYKLARDGVWEVWEGMLFSIVILVPIAAFFTYKSMRESAIFNTEVYNQVFRNIFRIKSDGLRPETKEPIYEEIPNLAEIEEHAEIIRSLDNYDNKALKDIVTNHEVYYESDMARYYQLVALSLLKNRGVYLFDVRVNNYDYEYSLSVLRWIRKTSLLETLPLFIISFVFLAIGAIFNFSIFSMISIASGIIYLLSLQKIAIYMGDLFRTLNQKKENILELIAALFIPKANKINRFWIGAIIMILYPISMYFIWQRLKQKIETIKDKTF